jgi:Putative zinc-finger
MTSCQMSELIPWYVNGTIAEEDRVRLEDHLSQCVGCSSDVSHERRVAQLMNADSPVEYMPTASLKRLQSRLDDTGDRETSRSDAQTSAPAARRRAMPWQGLLAASAAVMAVALGLLATDRWLQLRNDSAGDEYQTVTSSAPRAPGVVIRAVFAPDVTLVQLQRILDESQLKIVAGPTEAGVYSLAMNSSHSISASLSLLRAHPEVRFAEHTP